MQITKTRSELRRQLASWRKNGDRVAIVPTMGNLHDGHLSLVRIARQRADRVVVTLFVNPTQFGAGEDFSRYPRSPEHDVAKLRAAGVDMLFMPDVEAVYPFGIQNAARVSVAVPGLSDVFCGLARPGHFDGVTSVVMRLFALVQPDLAVFGQKDFQQQLIVRRLIEDLGLPIEIAVGAVVREPNGLAMSSRNAYLNDDERDIAAALHCILQRVADRLRGGNRNYQLLETEAHDGLQQAGHTTEYIAIRDAENLGEPRSDSKDLVILAATRVASVRLIDNVVVALQ